MLRLELVLDGEVVVRCRPVIGYLHTGIEKTFEAKTYVQGVVLTDRMDYLNPLGNNLAYALSHREAVRLRDPARAPPSLRVLLVELTRIDSHLMFVGSMALDLGASSPFLYAWREREKILDFFERLSGVRMMTSFIRPGGLAPRPRRRRWLADMSTVRRRDADVHRRATKTLLTDNPHLQGADRAASACSRAEDALALARERSDPARLRASPSTSARRTRICGYETYDFAIPIVATVGDCYDRYMVRVAEMRESVKICRQALERLPDGPVQTSDRKVMPPPREELASEHGGGHPPLQAVDRGHPAARRRGVRRRPSRRAASSASTSSATAQDGRYRVHERAPSFANLQALPQMAEGGAGRRRRRVHRQPRSDHGRGRSLMLSDAERRRAIRKLVETVPRSGARRCCRR